MLMTLPGWDAHRLQVVLDHCRLVFFNHGLLWPIPRSPKKCAQLSGRYRVSRILFGRAFSRHSSPLSQSRSKVDALCLRQLGVLLGDWLPGLIASFKLKEGDNSRERIYTLPHHVTR